MKFSELQPGDCFLNADQGRMVVSVVLSENRYFITYFMMWGIDVIGSHAGKRLVMFSYHGHEFFRDDWFHRPT